MAAEQRQPLRTEEPKARPPSTLAAGGGGRAFRETELGPLPVEWEVVRLGEVATFTRKPKGINLSEYDFVPFIPMELIPEAGLFINRYVLKPGDRIRSGVYCEKGDILLAKITPSFENGKQGIVGEIPLDFAYATTEVYPIRANPACIDRIFLFYFLQLSHVRASIAGKMEGSTGRQRIPKAVVENCFLPLPPLPEQRRIAHVLRTIRRAIEATDRVITAARELKRSLMHHLFTYGHVPVETTGRLPLRETDIGPVPAHWEVVRLREKFDIQQGKALSRKKDKGVRPRPFLRTANILWGRIDLLHLDQMDFSEEEEEKYRLQPGDLLVCEGGDVGRTAIWEGQSEGVYYQNHLHRLRPKAPDVETRFFMYWMQAAIKLFNVYLGTSNRTTIPNLSRSRLSSFSIPLPPLSEQREIARILQAVDRKIEAEERRRAALQALFKTMLHLLMTGRIRVEEGQG